MISLKRYLGADPRAGAIDVYRGLLKATGKNAVRSCQPVGRPLEERLTTLSKELAGPDYPEDLAPIGAAADEALQQWGQSMETFLADKVREVKDLIVVLAETAGTVGDRDREYTAQLERFTGQLQQIAGFNDLAEVRRTLVDSAKELRACVARMSEETQKTVSRLRDEVSTYQTKLETVEELASRDPLTGLFNRRLIDTRLGQLVATGQPFCAVIIDLDGFKAINDSLGHAAGDEVLKQFGDELKANARPGDVVGRLGGDEFVALLPCNELGAMAYVERVQKWVIGDYTVGDEPAQRKVRVDAAVGLAEWRPGESADQLLHRADAQMYSAKRNAAGR